MVQPSIPDNFSPDGGMVPPECVMAPRIEGRYLLGGELREWAGAVQAVHSPRLEHDGRVFGVEPEHAAQAVGFGVVAAKGSAHNKDLLADILKFRKSHFLSTDFLL